MARITDVNRIKRLKDSTMKLVVENGFGGASAAMIAIDAKVASGYFYMHYKGKYEMVNSLLQEVFQEAAYKLDEYLKTEHSFIQIVEEIVDHIFLIAEKDPVKLKFLYVLSNDYSFVIDDEIRLNVFNFLKRLKELGQILILSIRKSTKKISIYYCWSTQYNTSTYALSSFRQKAS